VVRTRKFLGKQRKSAQLTRSGCISFSVASFVLLFSAVFRIVVHVVAHESLDFLFGRLDDL